MGKKQKNKKKGLGTEKTASKTKKNLEKKFKKQLNEEDIEDIVKAIELEECKRFEVKIKIVAPPKPRANLTMTAHPEKPEIFFFGGEFYNGQKTIMFNDLFLYNVKKNEWKQIFSPGGPTPRSSHQAAVTAQNDGELWIFGGEYVNPTETQFFHYKDLWCLHLSTFRWEKVCAPGGPSPRSGHRMVLYKKMLIIFGGFHDNLRESKYFNDIHAFDINKHAWKKIEIFGGIPPSPRSGCVMWAQNDKGIIIYAGYSKVDGKKKDNEIGITHSDMFVLSPDKNDINLSRWCWNKIKQVGSKPTLRTGMSVAVSTNLQKVFIFGGVQDIEEEEYITGRFFDDLYNVNIENEKVIWTSIELAKNEETSLKTLEETDIHDPEKESTIYKEEGAFSITSSINLNKINESSKLLTLPTSRSVFEDGNHPTPRFSSSMCIVRGNLYLYGGIVEEKNITYTFNDFFSLDICKFKNWKSIIKTDLSSIEWPQLDSSESDSNSDSEYSTKKHF